MRKTFYSIHPAMIGSGAALLVAFLLACGGCSKPEKINAYPHKYAGVGLELRMDGASAEVVMVFQDGPADRAGIKIGDRIIRIDGESVDGLPLSSVIGMLRGADGSQVTMLVSRSGSGDATIIVKRSAIEKGSEGYRSSR